MGIFDDVKKRVNTETTREALATIYNNELSQFRRIEGKFRTYNQKDEHKVEHEKNKNGKYITYKSEGKYDEICTLKYENVEIKKDNDGISYWFVSGAEKILLGRISPRQLFVPQYGESEPLKIIGEVPLEQIKSTMIEMIEQNIRANPLFEEYADIILNDFAQILSMDQTKDIKPLSDEEVLIASLKSQIASLEQQCSTLEQENSQKEAQIGRLQAMLNKALTFATNVRDSFVGKIFFKNKIAQLDLPNGTLPEVGDTTIGEDDGER